MPPQTNAEMLQPYPSAIAALPAGEVSLGVPLLGEAVQVNGSGPAERIGRLIVATDMRQVTTISRTDGEPLQAVLLDDAAQQAMDQRINAFAEPVPLVRILPRTSGSGGRLWFAEAPGLEIHSQAALAAFCSVVGSHTLQKIAQQRR